MSRPFDWADNFSVGNPTLRAGRAEPRGADLCGWLRLDEQEPKVLVLFHTGEVGARLLTCLQTRVHIGAEPAGLFRMDPTAPGGWVRFDLPH